MPYNSVGTSFAPLGVNPVFVPAIKEPTTAYSNLTTAQCAANSALTAKSITSTATLVEAAKQRSKGIVVVVPTDQPAVAFANVATLQAGPVLPYTPITQTFVPGSPGFTVPSGGSLGLDPFNDPMYAITPAGVTATIYFVDPT